MAAIVKKVWIPKLEEEFPHLKIYTPETIPRPTGAMVFKAESDAVKNAWKVIVFYSPELVGDEVKMIPIQYAMMVRNLIPIMLKQCALPLFLAGIFYADLTGSQPRQEEGWKRVMATLRRDV